MQKLSIILPVLNEAPLLQQQLQRLQTYREQGHELLVIDGGSEDNTVAAATPLADQVGNSPAGRSLQMNHGAALATGDVLLFLHADTVLPANADKLIAEALAGGDGGWGWFAVRLDHSGVSYRVIGGLMNLRARLSYVCTGDQAMFVTRELFDKIGGFPPIPLMEDVALSKLLRRKSTPGLVYQPVLVNIRGWQQRGLVRASALMWWLRLLYFCGVSPERLVRLYYPARHSGSA